MGRVVSVPGWVRRPVVAVAGVEDFLLTVYQRTKAPQALGAWTSLAWVGDTGPDPVGPFRPGPASEQAASTDLLLGTQIIAADPYPPPSWWTERRVAVGDRMPPQEWAVRVGSMVERLYAHAVAMSLGWVLGAVQDAAEMAPLRDGDCARIPDRVVAGYQTTLRRLAAAGSGRPSAGGGVRAGHDAAAWS